VTPAADSLWGYRPLHPQTNDAPAPQASASTASRCGSCRRTWSRRGEAHCTQCHEQFASVSAFDLHQAEDSEGRVVCRHPETVLSRDGDAKLVRRPDGVWARPPMPLASLQAVRAEASDSRPRDAADQVQENGSGSGLEAGKRAALGPEACT
jgi:hypothetical protein